MLTGAPTKNDLQMRIICMYNYRRNAIVSAGAITTSIDAKKTMVSKQ